MAMFNSVRSAFHAGRGISGARGAPLPASTGIQGSSTGEECIMDVLALRGEEGAKVGFEPLVVSSRQHRAASYGSAFSRGMRLDVEGRSTIFVSGTASIGVDGETLHVGNREAQIIETLLCVAALLEPEGAGLDDICLGTVFCKDDETYRCYGDIARLLGILPSVLVPVLADVCRPDLLVEIEAMVIVPASSASPKQMEAVQTAMHGGQELP